MGIFQTATMKLTDSAGNLITGGDNLPCQIDNVNIPWQMQGDMGAIALDWYTIYSLGWISPVPARNNVLVDKATGTKYSVSGNPAIYSSHLEMQVTRFPAGSTP